MNDSNLKIVQDGKLKTSCVCDEIIVDLKIAVNAITL